MKFSLSIGFAECELNKLHGCVLHTLHFDKAFEILKCLMGSFQSSIDEVCNQNQFALTKLILKFCFQCNPNNYNLEKMWSCYNGSKSSLGRKLLRNNGELTNLIDLSFVPSIEIDQVSLKLNEN